MLNALEAAPQIFVLGGPNGAGKSTTAQVLLPHTLGVNQFVNADLIARGLSPFAPDSADWAAGEIMHRRIHELLQRRESFGFETTLASRSYASLLRQATREGFLVSVSYIWLSSVELAISRVNDRVRQGGHDVPVATIRRRYSRGLANFFNIYLPLAACWILCDNSGDDLAIVARGQAGGAPTVLDADRFDRIRRASQHG